MRIAKAAALAAAIAMAVPGFGHAASSAEHKARRPDLFHVATGLRIGRYRAPTPDDVPGGRRIGAAEVQMLQGAVLLDVGPAASSRFDELDGSWLVSKPHMSLPGAVWLPEVGRGTLEPLMHAYLEQNVKRLTAGDSGRAIVAFCIADCWMSWNATQRLTAMGYSQVYWFAEGIDGWLDQGWKLAPTDPVPVKVD